MSVKSQGNFGLLLQLNAFPQRGGQEEGCLPCSYVFTVSVEVAA